MVITKNLLKKFVLPSEILNTKQDVSLASNMYINEFIQVFNENSLFPNDCPSLHYFSSA